MLPFLSIRTEVSKPVYQAGLCGSFVGIVHDGEGKAVFFIVLMDAFDRIDGLAMPRT